MNQEELDIFVCYRRNDSKGSTGRIYDRLIREFDSDKIYLDVDGELVGEDFVDAISNKLATCKVMLVIIGPSWVESLPNLDNGVEAVDDLVLFEIKTALANNIKIIPVLVDGAENPKPKELSSEIAVLARRKAIAIRHENFHADMKRLIREMRGVRDKGMREPVDYDELEERLFYKILHGESILAIVHPHSSPNPTHHIIGLFVGLVFGATFGFLLHELVKLELLTWFLLLPALSFAIIGGVVGKNSEYLLFALLGAVIGTLFLLVCLGGGALLMRILISVSDHPELYTTGFRHPPTLIQLHLPWIYLFGPIIGSGVGLVVAVGARFDFIENGY